MMSNSVLLASSVTATTPAKNLDVGGRYALVLVASAYGTTVSLQLLGPDGATWITLNGTTYSANGLYIFDLPPGQYRMFINGGTTTALYASLVKVCY